MQRPGRSRAAALRRHDVGDEVRLDVERRDGERIEVTVRRVG
jgi:hypothetical protein